MNMKKLATLVSAVALSATVSGNAMAKDTIALVVSTLNNQFQINRILSLNFLSFQHFICGFDAFRANLIG